jgi:phosphohistidine phosphatase
MELYIVRHAWAADRDSETWPDDDLRPLTDDGKERFADLVAYLAKHGLAPQVIATSPLVRCRQTAEILSAGVHGKPEVIEVNALRPSGNLDVLLQWTAAQGKNYDRIAWVGHAPDVGRLTAAMIGLSDGQIRFAKGGVATIKFADGIVPAAGELQWLATAKILGC